MEIKDIIADLILSPKLYKDIKQFSDSPGIYAFFYEANSSVTSFPCKDRQLVYIGKTESSQRKRDANTHFKSGKTGSSTFRKSVGSILMYELNLNPIPRNDSDFIKGRTSMFKFDEVSEEQLTSWMKKNISMSFYEYNGSKEDLDELETLIINKLIPPLNISKNSRNPFKSDLQILRRNAANIAHATSEKQAIKDNPVRVIKNKQGLNTGSKKMGKYSKYWESQLPSILQVLNGNSQNQQLKLSKNDFDQLGNRKQYSFNIQFTGVKVTNNISGSAVARDLVQIMKDDSETRKLLMGGNYKVNMDKEFILHIQRV